MTKYVRCIDVSNDQRKWLISEHVYEVISETSIDYVIDIQGRHVYFRKSRFIEEGTHNDNN